MDNSESKGAIIKILGRKNDSNTWRSSKSLKRLVDYSFLVGSGLVDGENYNKDAFNVSKCAYYSCTLRHFNHHPSNLSKWIYRLQSGSGYGPILFNFLSKYVVSKLQIHPRLRGDFEKETRDPRNNGTSYLAGRDKVGLVDKKTMAQIEGK